MIFLRRVFAVAALIALGASLPVRAQGRAVTIFVYGGGYSALRDLNSAGTQPGAGRRRLDRGGGVSGGAVGRKG